MIDPRWRIPFNGAIEAIEVCVTSSPVDIEIQLWKEVAVDNGVLQMVDVHVFRGELTQLSFSPSYSVNQSDTHTHTHTHARTPARTQTSIQKC